MGFSIGFYYEHDRVPWLVIALLDNVLPTISNQR
jgi:hypothetical protein